MPGADVSLPRYAAARDANEPEIIQALEAAGAMVVPLHPTVPGLPDLLVMWRGRIILVEVKLPPGPKGGLSHSPLSNEQIDFRQRSPASNLIYTVRTAEQALQVLEGL